MKRLITFLVVGLILEVHGQSMPPDSALVQEQLVLQSDHVRWKDFEAAKKPTEWLIANAPKWHLSIYINAEKVYKELHKKRPEDIAIQEALLEALSLRMQYFGDHKEVLKRKSYWAYRFWKSSDDRLMVLKQLLDTTFLLNQNEVSQGLYIARLDVARRMKHRQLITELELVDEYVALSNNWQSLYPGDQKTQPLLDRLIKESVVWDCELLSQKMYPRLQNNPEDTAMAKLIIHQGLTAKCTRELFFQNTLEKLINLDPTFGLVKFLGSIHAETGNLEKAVEAYQMALEIAEEPLQRFDIHMLLAKHYFIQNQFLNARKHAHWALDASVMQSPYELIGDLYLSSVQKCHQGRSRVEDRAVYWIAYDMYQKTGNSEKMRIASEQFPSIEDLFNEDLKEGATYEVGCWINQKTVVRRRPAQNSE